MYLPKECSNCECFTCKRAILTVTWQHPRTGRKGRRVGTSGWVVTFSKHRIDDCWPFRHANNLSPAFVLHCSRKFIDTLFWFAFNSLSSTNRTWTRRWLTGIDFPENFTRYRGHRTRWILEFGRWVLVARSEIKCLRFTQMFHCCQCRIPSSVQTHNDHRIELLYRKLELCFKTKYMHFLGTTSKAAFGKITQQSTPVFNFVTG